MKKILFTLLALLLPLCAVAQSEGKQPNTLVVYLTNGAQQEYLLQESPEISFSGMDLVIKSGTNTIVIQRDDIARYQFAYRDVDAIEQVTTNKNIARRGNDVFIAAVRPGDPIALYTLGGMEILRTKANARGEASVSLSSLGQGVYLLTVNNFTTKIIKQ